MRCPAVLVYALVLGFAGCGEATGTGGTGGITEASGILDPTFGRDGIAVHDGAVGENSSDYGYDLTVDAMGRILVAGYGLKRDVSNYQMALWRYTPDGTLDPRFGAEGVVVYERGTESSDGYAIEIDRTERIVVAGDSHDGPDHMAVWRYKSDGTPDLSFGDGGVAVPRRFANDYGRDCTLDGAGRILVVGYAYDGDSDIVIWRLRDDGTLDPTFGADGIVVQDGAAGGVGRDEGGAISIDAAGKILVTGQSQNARGDYDMVILRYNPDGTPDASFGIDGIAAHDGAIEGVDSGGSAVGVDAAGKILVAGYSYGRPGDWDMALWRYNADGTVDSSFGSDGIVVHHGAAGGFGNDEAYDLAAASGKVVAVGRSESLNGHYDMALWRYSSDGTLDSSFGADGVVVHAGAAGGNGPDYGYALAIDDAGRVLVSGTSTNDSFNRDMVIWRYE